MTFEAASQETGTEPIHIGNAARAYREIRRTKDGLAVLKAIADQRAAATKLIDLTSEAAGIEAESIDAIAHTEGYPDAGQDKHIGSLLQASQEVDVERRNLPPIE